MAILVFCHALSGVILKVSFVKYSANGNDFILIDNRQEKLPVSQPQTWRGLCHRRWGVGADGILFLHQSKKEGCDYKMTYLNSDGAEVAMCGNGARALGAFVFKLPEFQSGQSLRFETLNAVYEIRSLPNSQVELEMPEFKDFGRYDLSDFAALVHAKSWGFADTGVPHCLFEVSDLQAEGLMEHARQLRFDARFQAGANINFFCHNRNTGEVEVRTFERGVDDETLACGTGVIAIARVLHKADEKQREWSFRALGGRLKVRVDNKGRFYFTGDLTQTFSGDFNLNDYRK